jgi:CRP/FNR family transcriptional regulator
MTITQSAKPFSNQSAKYIACKNCSMEPVCQPINKADQSLLLSTDYLNKRISIKAGSSLFIKGEPLSAMYAVCSGSFKLCIGSQDNIKIINFRFPGELLGEDALFPQKYACDAIALEESSICKVSVHELTTNANLVPDLQANLVTLLSRQSYFNQQEFASLVAKKSAESLLAAFLLNVNMRVSKYNSTANILYLTMSRENIANFLGLRRETLSRLLSKFQKDGIILLNGKNITLLNLTQLTHLAND